MRGHLSQIDSNHIDFPLLKVLEREINERAGGTKALQERFPALVRDAIDFLLDPVRTARTQVSELDNVEKTFIGLKLEHFVRDMLDVPKGVRDLVVAGMDVDIKNTTRSNWSIPQETYRNSEPCVLMAVNDKTSTCSLGLIVAKPEYLHAGIGNRDTKKGVSTFGFANILWLLDEAAFPSSRFSNLDMDRFRQLRKELQGNERAAQFLRENLYKVVHRDVMQALLFDQYDFMKRLRANGGAPDILRNEGIAILIGTYTPDRKVAEALGVGHLDRREIVGVMARSKDEWNILRSFDLI